MLSSSFLKNIYITGQSVKQISGIATVAEGQTISLNCSYEVQYSGMNYPFWYIQYPGQPLKLLLTRFNNSVLGFQATQLENDKKGTFNMQKQAIQLHDSAVYFCAFTDTTSERREGANQKQEEKN
uniref:Immunoglobulin V-set domain-containing protein n=1 Tax=Pseudonaja textilis TaxID=8673 RepID=A0A670ZGK9_PSETE